MGTKKSTVKQSGKELYKPKTRLVNVNMEPCEIFIGRPSKWGNPFREDVHGTKAECVEQYRIWLMKPEQKWILDDILELDGKVLGCYCYPKKCHGNELINFIEAAKNKQKLNGFFD